MKQGLETTQNFDFAQKGSFANNIENSNNDENKNSDEVTYVTWPDELNEMGQYVNDYLHKMYIKDGIETRTV
jgi:hypothetical protein